MPSNTSDEIQPPIGVQVINSLENAVRELFTSVSALEQKINPFLTTNNSKASESLLNTEWPAYFAQLRESVDGLQVLNERVQSLIERFPI